MACATGAGLLAAVAVALAALVHTGLLQLPLPAPAHGKHANVVPDGDVLRWRPRPLEGEFAPNERLRAAVRLFDGRIVGAESVAVGPQGQLVMLDRHGQLFEATQAADGTWALAEQPRARLGPGRPLGYHFDAAGDLIICDSLKGLLKYSYSSGDVTVLASHVGVDSPLDAGSPITYANDLAIDPHDGTIYFTSCTDIVPPLNALGFWDTFRAWFLGLMQGLPRGRLLKYDPALKQATVIAKGFYYANGVALSRDRSFVVMAETDRLRAHKIWVRGPKAGQAEVLIDRLPGVPDGVDEAEDGCFWISLVGPAPPFESAVLAAGISSPLVRGVAAWLPAALQPRFRMWGAVVKVDGQGRVQEWLMDADGRHVASVSAVSQVGRRLYLGNLVGSYVSYIELSEPADAGGGSSAGDAGAGDAGAGDAGPGGRSSGEL